MTDLSLALSGGGAAGYGHIVVLEALDELGVRPVAIAGASMGALIGVAYASGMSGSEIRGHVLDMVNNPLKPAQRFWHGFRQKRMDPTSALAAVSTMLPDTVPDNLSELQIPTTVVATDFYARAECRFSSGPLRPSVAASVSIPGLFDPTEIDGQFFIDGGVTNNLPTNALPSSTMRLAVDVASEPPEPPKPDPGSLEVTLGAMRIMMRALLEARLREDTPDVLIEPGSRRFGALDFLSAEEILEAAEPAREETKRAVESAFARA